jgi:predicted SprT family Zn-dependent metalloprotease
MNTATAAKTYTLKEYEVIAKDLMYAHGLSNWRFNWNDRKAGFGVCKYKGRTIELSRHLTPLRPFKEVVNTILHEIAHALVGSGHGHDWVWRSKFIEIGGDGSRRSSLENVDMLKVEGNNWVATCINGHVHVKFRQPKGGAMSCGKCSRKFDRNNLLKFERQY